jgi:hypothetical protein
VYHVEIIHKCICVSYTYDVHQLLHAFSNVCVCQCHQCKPGRIVWTKSKHRHPRCGIFSGRFELGFACGVFELRFACDEQTHMHKRIRVGREKLWWHYAYLLKKNIIQPEIISSLPRWWRCGDNDHSVVIMMITLPIIRHNQQYGITSNDSLRNADQFPLWEVSASLFLWLMCFR